MEHNSNQPAFDLRCSFALASSCIVERPRLQTKLPRQTIAC